MNKKESQILGTIMTFLLLISMVVVAKESARLVGVWQEKQLAGEMKTVVIDAGHGGNDPGKVGLNGALEKDINLAIAMRVKKYLEQEDINVIMTRQEDLRATFYDEATPVFTGYLSNKSTWQLTDSGIKKMTLTFEDVGTRLLGKTFLPSATGEEYIDKLLK